MMKRTVRNRSGRKFIARCGHLVPPDYDYIETSDEHPVEATVLRWCSPTCADRHAMGQPEVQLPTCAWKGCDEPGELRDIAVVLPAPALAEGVAIQATFSDDVPLCDEHAAELQAKMVEVLTEELSDDEEEHDGEDGHG